MIRCEDWRNAAPETLEALYEEERARWIGTLHWDADPAHRILEDARRKGHAPGLLALDDQGQAVGWAYYLLHHRTLQIGGLVATNGEVTRALLDAILNSPEAEMAAELLCFAYPASPAFESALARQRFAVTKYLYLSRHLTHEDASLRSGMKIAHWNDADAVATVRLMARAYAGVRAARCFAPRGTLEEWATYVAQLVKMPACGLFMPSASLSATEPGHEGPRGVLIATSLAPQTAHIAQVIVDPSLRRRGVARDLIETTCALAADAGCTRITLLVAEDNAPALGLYHAVGFEPTAHFLYATRQAPTRMRSVRPERTLVRPPTPALTL